MENVTLTHNEVTEADDLLGWILRSSAIQTVFQPIVSLRDGSVLGYEALSRGPEGTPLYSPDHLFQTAVECNQLWELELLCRTKALESAYRQQKHVKLFINVNPHIIYDEKFVQGFTGEYLKKYGIDPDNIHFEITEKNSVQDMEGFRKTIENYKKQNYKIAVDDVGAGYSGLNLISDIHPHYIKLDMNLIRNVDKDYFKKTLVKSIYDFCRLSGTILIAEGIETNGELNTLIDIGVHYGQGFLLQKPDALIKQIDESVLENIKIQNSKKNHLYYNFISNVFVGNLCRKNVTVTPQDPAEKVYTMFLKDPSLFGVTVVKDREILGIVTKPRVHFRMSGQYGYSLHAKRPIELIMDQNPLIVDYEVPIDIVTKLAMSRNPETLYDFIVVSLDSKYCGVVTIKDLLVKTMEIEVSNARHQNPLSGLPGNLVIESNLVKCVLSDKPFTVLYFDLDNFKAYNDVYGFENGDNVIKFLAELLKSAISSEGFIGHIGGDDFVAILPNHDAEKLSRSIIQRFDAGIREFYTREDLEKGFIRAKNRKGQMENFPLITLSIAGVTNRHENFQDIYQLSGKAGVLKKKCKQEWKSCCFIE